MPPVWWPLPRGWKADNRFLCVKAMVSYEHTNTSILHAQLFKSLRDGKHTGYQCAQCGCGHSQELLSLAETLKTMDNIKCFFHPNKPLYVYMESGSENAGLIIFLFTIELLLVSLLCFVEILCVVNCCLLAMIKDRPPTVQEEQIAKLLWPVNWKHAIRTHTFINFAMKLRRLN